MREETINDLQSVIARLLEGERIRESYIDVLREKIEALEAAIQYFEEELFNQGELPEHLKEQAH